jgi:hypothetical protein
VPANKRNSRPGWFDLFALHDTPAEVHLATYPPKGFGQVTTLRVVGIS